MSSEKKSFKEWGPNRGLIPDYNCFDNYYGSDESNTKFLFNFVSNNLVFDQFLLYKPNISLNFKRDQNTFLIPSAK